MDRLGRSCAPFHVEPRSRDGGTVMEQTPRAIHKAAEGPDSDLGWSSAGDPHGQPSLSTRTRGRDSRAYAPAPLRQALCGPRGVPLNHKRISDPKPGFYCLCNEPDAVCFGLQFQPAAWHGWGAMSRGSRPPPSLRSLGACGMNAGFELGLERNLKNRL